MIFNCILLTKLFQKMQKGNLKVSVPLQEWPITGGVNEFETPETHHLLLTGHEDGSVRFWDASGVTLSHLYTIHTSHIFVSEDGEPPVEEEEWPPFRKVLFKNCSKFIIASEWSSPQHRGKAYNLAFERAWVRFPRCERVLIAVGCYICGSDCMLSSRFWINQPQCVK